MEFLGHRVSQEGIAPLPGKVDSIRKTSTPASLCDIQVFIGMARYYQNFISHFAELAEPLVRLLTKNTPFYWGEEQESSFRALIKALATLPLLVRLNFDKPFIMFTNVSDVAIGAILAQHEENKVDHPIAYYSITLSKAERNYSVTKLECLAVLLTIKQFRPFLYGTHFTVVANHSSLKWLQQMKDPDGRLARWLSSCSTMTLLLNIKRLLSIRMPTGCLGSLPLPSLGQKMTDSLTCWVAIISGILSPLRFKPV